VFSCLRAFVFAVAVLSQPASDVLGQSPENVLRERADYLAWLRTATNSPLAAVAQQPVGAGLRLGPADADIPLEGVAEHRVVPQGGALKLQGPSGPQPVSRGRPVRLGRYTVYFTGSGRGTVVTVFGAASGKQPPGYYEYDSSLVVSGPLLPPEEPKAVRVLAADGIETEAYDAGRFLVSLGTPTRLRVLRIPGAVPEESELEIFFRDATNGHDTYPAGRFVSLIPLGDGQYRLDFNRARNPFCAYNSVYPCPAPWRGNTIAAPVRAGERYDGGGLDPAASSGTTR
jgi:hypothetical protein